MSRRRQLPRIVASRFAVGYELFRRAEPVMPALSGHTEHNHVGFQADLVQRFRVAVRLWLARVGAELWRGRVDRAANAAEVAGRYFAEYRRHYRHLLSIRAPAVHAGAKMNGSHVPMLSTAPGARERSAQA